MDRVKQAFRRNQGLSLREAYEKVEAAERDVAASRQEAARCIQNQAALQVKADTLANYVANLEEAMARLQAQSHAEHMGMSSWSEPMGALNSEPGHEHDDEQQNAQRPYQGPGPECIICAGTAPRNPRLCDSCQVYDDARHVLYCSREVFRASKDHINDGRFHTATLWEMQNKPNCIICQQITAALRDRNVSPDTKVINGGPYSFQHSDIQGYVEWDYKRGTPRCIPREIIQPDDKPSAIRCVFYILVDKDPLLHFTSGYYDHHGRSDQDNMPPEKFLGLQLVLHYSGNARCLRRVHPWEDPIFSSENLLAQLHKCELTHDGPCRAAPEAMLPESFRLVDTLSRCVVDHTKIGKELRYVALSYPWAMREQFPLLTTSSLSEFESLDFLSRHNTPDVVWDAIILCNSIGERYLWIDRLCILQDDEKIRQAQIQAMDGIYQNALVTIVAAHSDRTQGLPGTLERPRPTGNGWHQWRDFYTIPHGIASNFDTVINQSMWESRAWTFQEGLLSRRCIVVTDFQVYFSCSARIWEEETGEYGADMSRPPLSLITKDRARRYNINDYCDYVQNYTSRSLSFNTDILAACVGVTNVLGKQLQTNFLYGLPERYLLTTLLWSSVDVQMKRAETPEIPTWSWASWLGQRSYKRTDTFQDLTDVGMLARFHMIDTNGGLRQLEIEELWFGGRFDADNEQTLETLPDMELRDPGSRSPKREEATEFWKQVPQNPWTMLRPTSYSAASISVAAATPGSLLLRTTVASLVLERAIDHPIAERHADAITRELRSAFEPQVGAIEEIRWKWLEEDLDEYKCFYRQPCEVMVISAGIVGRFSRDGLGSLPATRTEEIWHLNVMLIERDVNEPMLCRRLALGHVLAKEWAYCKPRWETIVLA